MAAKKRKPGAGRPFAKNPRVFRLGGVRLTQAEMEVLENAHGKECPDEFFAPWVRNILLKHAERINKP